MESRAILLSPFPAISRSQTQIPGDYGDAQLCGREPGGDGEREAADEEGEKRGKARL